MPDNVQVDNNELPDYTVASDEDVSGNQHQWVKLEFGDDGVFTKVDAANPLPVDTELTAAAALSDTGGNPTTSRVGALGMLWDGTNWRRWPTASTLGDGGTGSTVAVVGGYLFNGTTWDRVRGNTAGAFAQGHVAHDAVDAGNPLKIGGKAETTEPTAVADADRVDAFFDEKGRQIIREKSRTATRSQVADLATNVTILAANELRVGATVFNDSTAVLYLGLSTTDVTTSNYTVQLQPGVYYEVPFGFVGAIEGLWATDPGTGGAKVTELT